MGRKLCGCVHIVLLFVHLDQQYACSQVANAVLEVLLWTHARPETVNILEDSSDNSSVNAEIAQMEALLEKTVFLLNCGTQVVAALKKYFDLKKAAISPAAHIAAESFLIKEEKRLRSLLANKEKSLKVKEEASAASKNKRYVTEQFEEDNGGGGTHLSR